MRLIPSLRTTGILLSTAAGLLLIRPASRWYESAAIDAWRRRIETAPAEDMAGRLSSATLDQGNAITLLVAALRSPRAELAQAAHDALAAKVVGTGVSASLSSSAQLTSLVEQMSASIDSWPPKSQQLAADLVEQILERSPKWDDTDRSAVLAACQLVLRSAAATKAGVRPASEPVAKLAALPSAKSEFPLETTPAEESNRVPGGGLPMNLPATAQTPVAAPADTRIDPAARERAVNEFPAAGSGNPEPPPRLLSPDPRGARPVLETSQNPLRKPSSQAAASETVRVSATSPSAQPDSLDDEALTVRWMHQLQSADKAAVRRAEDELRGRGFGEFQIELARRLTNENPIVRRQLAEAVPSMPQIDRKVWLIWLSRDEDAEVRLAALSIMATSGDPELIKRVEQIARQDSDPRIQRQGEKLQGSRR